MWNRDDWMWELQDGRVWSTAKAAFVDGDTARAWLFAHPGMGAIPPSPVDASGNHSPEGLREALIFYGLPLGGLESLADLKAAKLAEIDAGYEAAMAASLTMPMPHPSAIDVSVGAALFAAEDPEGLECVAQVHQARREELELELACAGSAAAVAAIRAGYDV